MSLIKSAALIGALAAAPCAFADEAEASLSLADNGFILLSAMLVLFMSVPAIGLFYGGMARSKNVLSVLEQCLVVFSMAIMLWFIVGYSIAFGPTDGFLGDFVGGLGNLFITNVGAESLSGTISEYTWVIFQGAFCAISACLIVGSTVERVKFSGLILAVGIWIVFSYAPLCHMVWGGGFIDSVFHAYDFAGGTVVHINAGVCGIVGALMVGKRHDLGRTLMAPHNVSYTYIGAALLWIGWLGFNAGSELTADGISALAFINTVIAPAAAALAWMAGEWISFKKPSNLGTSSGVVAGLVAITPACAFVGPVGAMVIGIVAGFVGLWGVHGFKRMTGIDDSLDVFGVHGLCGITGAILTGIFCAPSLGGQGFKEGWDSIAGQLYGQFMSVVVTIIWAAVVAFIAFKIADLLVGIRVTPEEESEGLDLASHGERGYNL